LDFATTTGTYGGNLTGSGNVQITSGSVLTLSGANGSFTGNTTVDSTSQLIGTTSSLQGRIADDGLVKFNQAFTGTYGGVLSGKGNVEVDASTGSIVTFNAINSYSGTTLIDAGTLQVGDAQALGMTAGTTVATGAVLDLNGFTVGPELLTVSGNGINGNGALINSTGSASFAGAVILAGNTSIGGVGNLTLTGTVDGRVANTDSLTIVDSGTKTFTGVIGGQNSLAGIAQGSSSGTLEFDKNVTIGSGGATFNGDLVFRGIIFQSIGAVTIGNSTITNETFSITGGATTVQTSAGAIILNSTTTAHNNLTLSAGGSTSGLTMNAATTGITADPNVNLTFAANGQIAIDSPIKTTTGILRMAAVGGITEGSSGAINALQLGVTNAGSGNIDLKSQNSVGTFAANNQATGGHLTLEAIGSITIGIVTADVNAGLFEGASGISSRNGDVAITATGSLAIDAAIAVGTGAAPADITIASNSTMTISAPIANQTGGNISLQTAGSSADVQIEALIAAAGGNGNISIDSGRDIQVVHTGPSSAVTVDVQVVGNGLVNLSAHNLVTFDPNVLIQTGTGAIAGTPPVIAVQTPQLDVLGQELATVQYGRPGERNFTITINWGDGSTSTFLEAASGQLTAPHLFISNPNQGNPSAPISITFEIVQDSHVNIVSHGATQNTTAVTSTAQLPGLGIASNVANLAMPAPKLVIPDSPKLIEVMQSAIAILLDNSVNQGDMVRTEQLLTVERVVNVEILSPDGGVQQRVPLPESTLDSTLEVIRKLPDGNYRFQLQEPGEERQRLLLEFEVRQGKIVDRNDESYRRPSASKPKASPAQEAPEKLIDTTSPNDAAMLDFTPILTPDSEAFHFSSDERGLPTEGDDGSTSQRDTKLTLAVHRAWKRAERLVDNLLSDVENNSVETAMATDMPAKRETDTPGNDEMTQGSVMLLGATAVLFQTTRADIRAERQNSSLKLSRAAQLFRKFIRRPNSV